jgi:hypothetical protein
LRIYTPCLRSKDVQAGRYAAAAETAGWSEAASRTDMRVSADNGIAHAWLVAHPWLVAQTMLTAPEPWWPWPPAYVHPYTGESMVHIPPLAEETEHTGTVLSRVGART